MKRLSSPIALLMLAGCSEESGRIYTVKELVADEAVLSRIIAECRNNPGELRTTPNYQNAEAADGKLRLKRMRQALGG